MAKNTITITRRISLPTAVLAWIFIFVVPAVLLHFSLQYLFNLTFQANKREIAAAMLNEIGSFRRDLETTAFLDRKLGSFFSADADLSAKISPAQLMGKLAAESNIECAAVISHGPDTVDVDYVMDQRLTSQMPGLPKNLMRRYLVGVNGQTRHGFCSQSGEAATRALFKFADPAKSNKDSEQFFRRQFNLICEMPLIPKQTSKSLSSRLGGACYFYYWPLFGEIAGKKLIKGGYLLVIRGVDLKSRAVLSDALRLSGEDLKRSYAVLPQPDWKNRGVNRDIITSFTDNKQGLHLTSTVSQATLIDLIQRGSFVPARLYDIAESLPLIRVSVEHARLQHPLFSWAFVINLFSRIFVLAGGVLLLRIFMFGLEFNAGISTKVLLGSALILLLPVLLLFAGFISWNQFHRVYGWYHAEERQRQFFEEFQEKLDSYLSLLQQQSLALAEIVKKHVRNHSDDSLPLMLQEWMKTSAASDLFLERQLYQNIHIRSEKHKHPVGNEEESTRRIIASAIINSFDENGVFNDMFIDGNDRKMNAVDAAFVNELINRWGRLFKMFRFKTASRYSSVFIHNSDKYSPYGLLSLRFFDDVILHDFVARHFKRSVKNKDIKLQFYFVKEVAGHQRYYDLLTGKRLADNNLITKINQAADTSFFSWKENQTGLMQVRWVNNFPLVLVAKSENVTGNRSELLLLAALFAYCILLMLFLLLVFVFIYLRPIREFIRVTEAVAADNYGETVRIDQTDEFGDLKKSFDHMISGLEQRRRLSHFVSQEVMRAVASDSDETMAPGGEKIEATVVFIQLEELKHLNENASADELFASMSRFITVADHFASLAGGIIDKVIENTLMLVFRAGHDHPDHCVAACVTSLAIAETMKTNGFTIRAGIASGAVVSGRIGSRLGKLDFTVIGDTVNLAARLKAQATKASQTGIIISPSAIRTLKGLARVNFIERCEIKGKSREYPIYELTGLRS